MKKKIVALAMGLSAVALLVASPYVIGFANNCVGCIGTVLCTLGL